MDNILNEPAPAYQKAFYIVAEYLKMEKVSDTKHEFFQGKVFAMAEAGRKHNVISKNISDELYIALRGKPCQSYGRTCVSIFGKTPCLPTRIFRFFAVTLFLPRRMMTQWYSLLF